MVLLYESCSVFVALFSDKTTVAKDLDLIGSADNIWTECGFRCAAGDFVMECPEDSIVIFAVGRYIRKRHLCVFLDRRTNCTPQSSHHLCASVVSVGKVDRWSDIV